MTWLRILMVAALGMACACPALAGPGTVAGELWVEPPTLLSIGFEWRIAGDDNRNASVAVSYRRRDEQEWHGALPLLRLQGESVSGGGGRDSAGEHGYGYTAPNMFAGSILGLQPDTEYECRLILLARADARNPIWSAVR